MRIVLGVSGGIAAYKSALLLRLLTEAGHDVRVVPTRASLEFVGAATWEALSGHPVSTEVFEDVAHVPHVALGKSADLVVVAPATADLLSRAATGRADDLLTATLLTARCPVLLVPAMHTEMWEHPATVANVRTLRERGAHVLEPASGRLTGADTGPGRMPDPEVVAAAALALVDPAPDAPPQDLAGRHVVVSAGGTREPLDPVRYLGNRSSGRQGHALAQAARRRGARVTLVAANVGLPALEGVETVAVETTEQLRDGVRSAAKDADAVVMAAAVADYRPEASATSKIKKSGDDPLVLRLVQNPDILAELASERLRPGQVIVGFAAETGDDGASVLDHGRAKALRKGADLMVVNAVGEGRGFGTTDNEVTILDRDAEIVATASGSKDTVADAVWDAVLAHL
ncbi:bifunctional phosphopantothenoylcysteine decarboxylase/phosphopantothenate--cysteine ligase CoaBC [Cellulomonas chengniuliangii]|uniref:Coenzyme A biosynthesis bifunctional protein CoaBC n=1 Tax=Cellulomonas chengniuliangii TaxID=2968084 RepID=A0ABY5L453_9CELL|nr:bifunctional phosphopantothenoylcysteine decarboxylase/phosphopantothenate--cysteine ligase CoaBC [Cellulomonas chengniuliangii]MCC2308437.1 bifunctional phosphopantothenoylcysteine decarboxylase/phosphopantothenate--cysteine ligase CoaBC [Cellulomonas chengniuliangii]MCC2317454.1 bifunctional phosphopantothenoylcysteine decarboxylase/phosphopantothenate--cysteine ligase CoaBC [Cellulomonas chengniuliangii]UUI76813.1 bifunctional phosphopantothenoylcysteine decarboxylase/phosphopantothenate--